VILRNAILATTLLMSTATSAIAATTIVHAGRLIDGSGGAPRERVSIVIDDDRIRAVEPGFVELRAGETLVDLSKQTVLPGLIDMHVHITHAFHLGDPIRNAVTRSAYDELIDGVKDVRATLLAGFTSIRSVGDATTAVVALKRAVNEGSIPGQRPDPRHRRTAAHPRRGDRQPRGGAPDRPPAEARGRRRDQDHAVGRGHVDRRRS
jgi:hypothetical protein